MGTFSLWPVIILVGVIYTGSIAYSIWKGKHLLKSLLHIPFLTAVLLLAWNLLAETGPHGVTSHISHVDMGVILIILIGCEVMYQLAFSRWEKRQASAADA